MAAKDDPAEHKVVVSRQFDAPPELVFDAWLDPKSVGRWLFATPGGRMTRVELDPRVGGKFTIVERRDDVLAGHFGTFVEIDRPRKLVFDFTTELNGDPTAFYDDCHFTETGARQVSEIVAAAIAKPLEEPPSEGSSK